MPRLLQNYSWGKTGYGETTWFAEMVRGLNTFSSKRINGIRSAIGLRYGGANHTSIFRDMPIWIPFAILSSITLHIGRMI